MPRTWTATALLGFPDTAAGNDDAVRRIAARIGSAPYPAAGDRIKTEMSPGQLRILFRSGSADRSFEQLYTGIARVLHEEAEARRQVVAGDIRQLETELEASGAAVEAAARDLAIAREATLSGEQQQIPGRIADLDARTSALAAQLAAHATAREALEKRRAEVLAQIEMLRPDIEAITSHDERITALRAELSTLRARGISEAARVEELENRISRAEVERAGLNLLRERALARLNRELQPALAGLDGQLRVNTSTSRDIEDEQHARQLAADAAREELSRLLASNPDFLEREREWKALATRDGEMRARLQSLRDQLVVGRAETEAPFELRERPSLPSRPDGMPPWLVVALSLSAGLAGVALRLVLGYLLPGGATSGQSGQVARGGAPAAEQKAVRWDAVMAALLLAVTVAACALFLTLFM